ncbi:MAG: peptidylprolyl isomerase [Pseudomonadota bacterium]
MKKNKTSFFPSSLSLKPLLLSVFTSLAILSSTPTLADEVLIDRIAAVVNDRIILKSELNAQMQSKAQELAAQNIPVEDTDALQAKVLDSMILETLQLERAEQLGLQVEDQEVNKQLQQIAAQNKLTLMDLRTQLNRQMPDGFQKLRENIKNKILIQKLREVEVISRAYVNESEIEHYLQRESLETSDTEVRLGHILIELPDSATPDQRNEALAKAQNLLKRINSGEDFSQLAVRYSNGSKALNGGDLGWLKQAEVPTFFAEAISGLKTGEVSEVIQSPSGFHLIKVIDQQDQALQLIKEYHLHRFIILSDNADQNNIPAHLIELTSGLKSLEDFNSLNMAFPDIPKEVNAASDLGWKTLEALPSPIRTAVANLEKNRALPPLATEKGWMILFLQDTRIIDQKAVDKTQQAIQAIRIRKANEMFDLWLRRLQDEAFIQILL